VKHSRPRFLARQTVDNLPLYNMIRSAEPGPVPNQFIAYQRGSTGYAIRPSTCCVGVSQARDNRSEETREKPRGGEASISWNYTTWLNIVFLAFAALLAWPFITMGGADMLRRMNRPMRDAHTHHHGH